jgi:hypothetical protein
MSSTGTYGDWNAVIWLLLIVLAWFSIAAVLAPIMGRMLRRRPPVPVRQHQPVRVIRPARDRDAA